MPKTPTAHIHLDDRGRAWIDDTNTKVSFHFKTLNHDIVVTRDRLDMQMIRQRLATGDDKTQ